MAGVTRPDPTLQETVSYLMAYMLREGVSPADPTRPAGYRSISDIPRVAERR